MAPKRPRSAEAPAAAAPAPKRKRTAGATEATGDEAPVAAEPAVAKGKDAKPKAAASKPEDTPKTAAEPAQAEKKAAAAEPKPKKAAVAAASKPATAKKAKAAPAPKAAKAPKATETAEPETIALNPEDEAKMRKKIKALGAPNAEAKPGVVYLGRIPHGFYEEQMKEYFSQFGEITRLRLSRNKKTGRSKHYAFLEFKNADVAKIVADTMDNYLLFGHLLKCHLMDPSKVHDETFKGANRRFKVLPIDKIERERHNGPRTEEQREKQVKRLLEKEEIKRKKLAEVLGKDFEFGGYAAEIAKAASPKAVAAAPASSKKRKAVAA